MKETPSTRTSAKAMLLLKEGPRRNHRHSPRNPFLLVRLSMEQDTPTLRNLEHFSETDVRLRLIITCSIIYTYVAQGGLHPDTESPGVVKI